MIPSITSHYSLAIASNKIELVWQIIFTIFWPYVGDILLATTMARGSMDSNSLAKGGVWGCMGLA
jgi:hypothetical protein